LYLNGSHRGLYYSSKAVIFKWFTQNNRKKLEQKMLVNPKTLIDDQCFKVKGCSINDYTE